LLQSSMSLTFCKEISMSKGNDKSKHKLTIKEKQARKKEKMKNKEEKDTMEIGR